MCRRECPEKSRESKTPELRTKKEGPPEWEEIKGENNNKSGDFVDEGFILVGFKRKKKNSQLKTQKQNRGRTHESGNKRLPPPVNREKGPTLRRVRVGAE